MTPHNRPEERPITTSNAIEFDGKCAFAVSVGAPHKAPDAKPEYTLVKDGKTYGFLSPVPKFLFRILPGSTKRAHAACERR